MVHDSTPSNSIHKKIYSFWNPESSSLMCFGFLVLLLWVLVFISKFIWIDMVVNYNSRQIQRTEEMVTVDNQTAYQFLTKSAYQYYRNGAYGESLREIRLAHRIYPSKYEVNYIKSITLIALCKQRGIYCQEAETSLNYLNEHWILEKEWLEDQNLALGIMD